MVLKRDACGLEGLVIFGLVLGAWPEFRGLNILCLVTLSLSFSFPRDGDLLANVTIEIMWETSAHSKVHHVGSKSNSSSEHRLSY